MTNIELEKSLDALSQLCCEMLAGNGQAFADRRMGLLKNVLECGFARSYRQPLQVVLEKRVRERWGEPIFTHSVELQSVAGKLQDEFDNLKRWEAKLPQETDPPDAANLNTAGHAVKRQDLHP